MTTTYFERRQRYCAGNLDLALAPGCITRRADGPSVAPCAWIDHHNQELDG